MLVKELATLLGLEASVLIEKLKLADIDKGSENDKITIKEKNIFIKYLQKDTPVDYIVKSGKRSIPIKVIAPEIESPTIPEITAPTKKIKTVLPQIKPEKKQHKKPKVKRAVLKPILFLKEDMTVENFLNSTHMSFTTLAPLLNEWGINPDLKSKITLDELITIASAMKYPYVTTNSSFIYHDYSDLSISERAPMITLIGHVDHGKTSLLDCIRNTHLLNQEMGGITQKIGAYTAQYKDNLLTFIDTPGHKAFSSIREMCSNITDIAVLVVASDSGLQPQTLEAIEYIRAKALPTVIAITKIDRPHPPIDEIFKALAAQGLLVEQYGGDIQAISVSVQTLEGINELLDSILALSDILGLQAYNEGPAEGMILETRLDHRIGPRTSLIIKNGLLKQGDIILCGTSYASVKSIRNEYDQVIKFAGPSIPVEIIGLDIIDTVGIPFTCVKDIKTAKSICDFLISHKLVHQPSKDLENIYTIDTHDLISLFDNMNSLPKKDNLILKADSKGSLLALKKELLTLATDNRNINILRESIGSINESDLEFAHSSGSIILAFNSQLQTPTLNKKYNIHVIQNNIVYRIIEEMERIFLSREKLALKEILGSAEVIAVFDGKNHKIAGCKVLTGKLVVNARVTILRNDKPLLVGKIQSIRHLKISIKEAKADTECGIIISGYNPQIGDKVEFTK